MDVWRECAKGMRKKLQKVGETRWRSKDAALRNIFGTYDTPEPVRFIVLLRTLPTIRSSKEFDSKVTYEASALYQNWKFETILTAFFFKRIFQFTTPVSKYLQTQGLDVMTAYRMAPSLGTSQATIRETFCEMHKRDKEFAESLIEEGLLLPQSSKNQE